jgi:hypothetical protein
VTNFEGSEFWRELGSEHAASLDAHGFGLVKRVQALRYFTWRWSPKRWLAGTQGRYLLRNTSPFVWIEALLSPTPLSPRAWSPVAWGLRDRWLYVLAVRLLWEVARKKGSAEVLALDEPRLGHPFPVSWRGRLISQDLANTALEVSSIVESLGGRHPKQILEVGAGYGRTAHALLSLFPDATYTIVDIPPALEISRWYLSKLFPERNLSFVDARVQAYSGAFDLGVSISTLSEMRKHDVERYLDMFATHARPGASVYLKQWHHWFNPSDHIELRFADFAPPGGHQLFVRRAPVQTEFVEGAWRM